MDLYNLPTAHVLFLQCSRCCKRVGSQRFTQNAHSLQKIVIMAPTFNGIELEDGNAAVAFKQRIKSRDAV
jgi:hypothetical protein